MRIHYHVYAAPAPIGLLFLAATERGLRYLEFLDRRSIKRVIASHAAENPGAEWVASLLALRDVTDQLSAYFHGVLPKFAVPLDPAGTDFQRAVWNALAEVPFGETRSYAAIARAIGQPRAARAVGLANNQNPVAIIVPCHRVIGADGSMTGYGGGVTRKRWLIEHEARFARATLRPGELTETIEAPLPRGSELPRVPAPAAAAKPARPKKRPAAKPTPPAKSRRAAPRPASGGAARARTRALVSAKSGARRRS